jgi:Mycothiol maleylpyruvate isomerase N-terminal domain
MSEWAKSRYGDPCRECGFAWSISADEAAGIIAATPARYAEALDGHDPSARHPGLGWSARGYVCHVTDNLRIWAERLAGAAMGGSTQVAGYDNDLLATARSYEKVSIEGALWSLRHAADAWAEAFRMAQEKGIVLDHQDRGEQSVLDVARTNAHDAFHHEWDIRRSVT